MWRRLRSCPGQTVVGAAAVLYSGRLYPCGRGCGRGVRGVRAVCWLIAFAGRSPICCVVCRSGPYFRSERHLCGQCLCRIVRLRDRGGLEPVGKSCGVCRLAFVADARGVLSRVVGRNPLCEGGRRTCCGASCRAYPYAGAAGVCCAAGLVRQGALRFSAANVRNERRATKKSGSKEPLRIDEGACAYSSTNFACTLYCSLMVLKSSDSSSSPLPASAVSIAFMLRITTALL